ncbi:MAG: hypothetical protein ACYDGO_01605 [Smithellaceae bacterium]
MQTCGAGKQDSHESLCEELLRERAAVLSRAGFAVEDALEKVMKIDRQIEEKMHNLRLCQHDRSGRLELQHKQLIFEEINTTIDQFNKARQKAETQYYYFIVTREALGLRRHEMVRQLYQVPPIKKKIQAI